LRENQNHGRKRSLEGQLNNKRGKEEDRKREEE
jgi:hypothetical protein